MPVAITRQQGAASMSNYQASVKTPFAHLGLRIEKDELVGIEFIHRSKEIKPSTQAAENLCDHLRQYCSKPRDVSCSGIACNLKGTPFQLMVWNALRKIPAGKVVTYGELAKKLGSSARAVGNACRNNPVPVIVPCHRVVSANGPGGYAGETRGALFDIKLWLLDHEGALDTCVRQ